MADVAANRSAGVDQPVAQRCGMGKENACKATSDNRKSPIDYVRVGKLGLGPQWRKGRPCSKFLRSRRMSGIAGCRPQQRDLLLDCRVWRPIHVEKWVRVRIPTKIPSQTLKPLANLLSADTL